MNKRFQCLEQAHPTTGRRLGRLRGGRTRLTHRLLRAVLGVALVAQELRVHLDVSLLMGRAIPPKRILTPRVLGYRCDLGFLIPLRCALRDIVWLVWFFDFALSVSHV